MLSCVERSDDPFVVCSDVKLDHDMINFELDFVPPALRHAKMNFKMAEPKHSNSPPRRLRTARKTRVRGFLERLAMAVVGGAFLIGPMWLMVLDTKPYTGLISASVFVFAFGIAMAVVLHKETATTVMTATAAYAAVLVVSVGSTSSPTNGTGS